MSLKDHIETVIQKVGSQASMPRGSGDMVSLTASSTVYDYGLPKDGYVVACFKARQNTWNGLENLGTTGSQSLASQVLPYSSDAESLTTFFVTGKKGDTVRLTVNATSDIGWLRFIPSVLVVLKALFSRLCVAPEVSYVA